MSHTHTLHLSFQLTRDDGQVRHNIELDLELTPEGGFYVIRQALPECYGGGPVFTGRGRGQMGAVLSWLSAVDQSLDYRPAWKLAETALTP